MGAVAEKISLREFERLYGDRKPYHEYWFGEAAPKATPNTLHGLLQILLARHLLDAGYRCASEVKLKLSADFQPVPDVIAKKGRFELPYPASPFDIAIEILSPEDVFKYLIKKCRIYSDWGIRHVFVIDPEDREAWQWDRATQWLVPVSLLAIDDHTNIPVARLFEELDAELAGE